MPASNDGLPPGWYYTQGDPVGTQRYWDGFQWVGGLQAGGGQIPTAPGRGPAGDTQPGASSPRSDTGARIGYWDRLVGGGVDLAPLISIGVVGTILESVLSGSGNESIGLVVGLVTLVVMQVVAFGNLVWHQASGGQSLGKMVNQTRLVDQSTGEPPGVKRLAARYLPVALFCASWVTIVYLFVFLVLAATPWLVNMLWSVWDNDDQRLVDKVTRTIVVSA